MEVMDHSVNSVPNISTVDDPDLTWQRLNTVQMRKVGSSAAATNSIIPEHSASETSGIGPGRSTQVRVRSELQSEPLPLAHKALLAAALFITLLLALYAVLWKCMDSKVPQRKKSKLRVRVRQMNTVA